MKHDRAMLLPQPLDEMQGRFRRNDPLRQLRHWRRF
jgi:hypothetical protein